MIFFYDYGLFILKVITIIFFLTLLCNIILKILGKKNKHLGVLNVILLNDHYQEIKNNIMLALINKHETKTWHKNKKKIKKKFFKE